MPYRWSEESSHADYLIAGSEWRPKRFRFGPVEWLWRTLTYRKWKLMRIQQPIAATVGESGALG